MKRLPWIMMAIIATMIVLVALTVSGLTLVLPHINKFCPEIISLLNFTFDADIKLQQLHGCWQALGPKLYIEGIEAMTTDGQLQVQHATLALNVWQSLLHWRWQFRDINFYHLQLNVNSRVIYNNQYHRRISITYNKLFNFILHQFDHVIFCNSKITFLTSSGERTCISVPQFTWFNTANNHRTESKKVFFNHKKHQIVINACIDLHHAQGLINNSKVYLKTLNIDLKPCFSQILQQHTNNVRLQNLALSFAAWLKLDQSKINSIDVLLSQGVAFWYHGEKLHCLDVDKLSLKINKKYKKKNYYSKLDVPALKINIDGQSLAPTALSLFWLPAKYHLFCPDQNSEICLRVKAIKFNKLTTFLSFIATINPQLSECWHNLKPSGELTSLALYIPIKDASATRFQAQWQDISWRSWQDLPGADHFSGSISGCLSAGWIKLVMNNSIMLHHMFRMPIALYSACATLEWRYHPQDGLVIWGHKLNARAQSLWAKGNLYFHKPVKSDTWLDLLASMHLTDAADAWRYYPETLMSTYLVDYLTDAIKGGNIANATLLFAGNPKFFPFNKKHNKGKFELFAPLRQAEYILKSGCPALKQLNIDLNFVNNGLFISTPKSYMSNMFGKNIVASIPDYSQQKMLIHANISSTGNAIRKYLLQATTNTNLNIFEELQLSSGVVMSDLHLTIPLNSQSVTAYGNILLIDNSLYIKSLSTKLEQINGKLCYNNGRLTSDKITCKWFDQPIKVIFTTLAKSTSFNINVGVNGNWLLNALPKPKPKPKPKPNLASQLLQMLSGRANWQSQIAIKIPIKGTILYKIAIKSDFKNVSSYLPAPLYKSSGQSLELKLNVQGNMQAFCLSGKFGDGNSFNSQWFWNKSINLIRGVWDNSSTIPPLPNDNCLLLLPKLEVDKWLMLLNSLAATTGDMPTAAAVWWQFFPDNMKLRTPVITFGKQTWHQLVFTSSKLADGSKLQAHGQEINGTFTILNHAPWRVELAYLYYNPVIVKNSATYTNSKLFSVRNTLATWPKFMFTCQQCWLKKQNIGRVSAIIKKQQKQFLFNSIIVDNSKIYLTAEGNWLSPSFDKQTAFKGNFRGKDISEALDYLGLAMPLLRAAPFDINYNVYWHAAPWQPNIASLNGILHTKLHKKKINSNNYILRLVSFDMLLRKLQFYCNDSFLPNFHLNFLQGTYWLQNGVLHTNDLLIDGLEAKISIWGYLDWNRQQINIEAVFMPNFFATVGLTTSLIINPIIGAAVFAASKVLAPPFWNKLSLIRYHIFGNLAMPEIQ